MNKRVKINIWTIGLVCVLGYTGIWLTYYFSVSKANKKGLEMACKENKEQEFEGQIVSIDRFEYDEFMNERFFNLKIKTQDTLNQLIDYHYNLKPNKDILEFAAIEQRVIKIKGQENFTIIDFNNNKKTFKIAKCANYE